MVKVTVDVKKLKATLEDELKGSGKLRREEMIKLLTSKLLRAIGVEETEVYLGSLHKSHGAQLEAHLLVLEDEKISLIKQERVIARAEKERQEATELEVRQDKYERGMRNWKVLLKAINVHDKDYKLKEVGKEYLDSYKTKIEKEFGYKGERLSVTISSRNTYSSGWSTKVSAHLFSISTSSYGIVSDTKLRWDTKDVTDKLYKRCQKLEKELKEKIDGEIDKKDTMEGAENRIKSDFPDTTEISNYYHYTRRGYTESSYEAEFEVKGVKVCADKRDAADGVENIYRFEKFTGGYSPVQLIQIMELAEKFKKENEKETV